MAKYPVFLKKQPLIWGISLPDIFKLTGLMFVSSFLDISQEVVLAALIGSYGCLLISRKIFPKHHLEFLLKKKDRLSLHLAITNAKERSHELN